MHMNNWVTFWLMVGIHWGLMDAPFTPTPCSNSQLNSENRNPETGLRPIDSNWRLNSKKSANTLHHTLYTLACNTQIDNYRSRISALRLPGEPHNQLVAQLKRDYPDRHWRSETAWEILNDEIQTAPQQARQFADRFKAVSVKRQSATYQAAFSRMLSEDWAGAIQTLQSDDCIARLAKNQKAASAAKAQTKPAHKKAEAQTLLDLEQLLLLAELQALTTDLSAAETTYQTGLMYAPAGHAIAFAYGAFLRNHFRPGQAQTHFQTRIGQLRPLAQQQPEQYLPALAHALYESASLHLANGEMAAAKDKLDEALRIRKALAKQEPALHTADCIATIMELGQWHHVQSQFHQARAVWKEASEWARNWAQQDALDGPTLLANSLQAYGQVSFDLKDYTAGQTAMEEAIAIRWDLAKRDSIIFQPDLANSLATLAHQVAAEEYNGYATQLFEYALQIYEDFAENYPETYRPKLAATHTLSGGYQIQYGYNSSAQYHFAEAIDIYEALVLVHPTSYESQLAICNGQIGRFYRRIGYQPQSYAYLQKALEIDKEYAKEDPNQFIPRIIQTLIQMGWVALEAYDPPLADEHLQEALKICQIQQEQAPQIYQPLMAECILTMGEMEIYKEQYPTALPYLTEAMGLYRKLAANEPEIYLPLLANNLHYMGKAYIAESKTSEAIAAFTEALALRDTLFQQHPLNYGRVAAYPAEELTIIYHDHLNQHPDPQYYQQALSLCKRSRQYLAVYGQPFRGYFQEEIDRLKDRLDRNLAWLYELDPAFLEMQAHLDTLFQQVEATQDYAQKAAIQAEVIATLSAILDSFPHYRDLTDNYESAVGILGWYQLCARQYSQAEISIRKSITLDEGSEWDHSLLLYALLLQGKWKKAKTQYRSLENDPRIEPILFQDIFTFYMDELEAAGITHPGFAKARKLMEQPPSDD